MKREKSNRCLHTKLNIGQIIAFCLPIKPQAVNPVGLVKQIIHNSNKNATHFVIMESLRVVPSSNYLLLTSVVTLTAL